MYSKQYTVKEEHIDSQGIVDGLYYPFYMEDCRHAFVDDVLGFNLDENAQKGINLVLSEYTIKFLRSLKKGDQLQVTCWIAGDLLTNTRFVLKQEILVNGKKFTEGIFTGTCVSASGGRPFLTEQLLKAIEAEVAK